MRILLDTDIGDDIDDAYALALALLDPAIELVGITTVWGDTSARARMARHLLDVFGHGDIPVYEGVGKTILGNSQVAVSQAQLEMTPARYLPQPAPCMRSMPSATPMLILIAILCL